jgi:protein phosphatase
LTDIGSSRTTNEDDFFLSDDCKVWIVADGMGGQAAGETATRLAIAAIAESFNPSSSRATSIEMSDRLLTAVSAAQDRVLARSVSDPSCCGMGAAVVVCVLHGDALHICHVGDARCYIFADHTINQITQDHSVVGGMVRAGLLTADQARTHSDKGLLQQAIGLARGIKPEVATRNLATGDRVLLCSDGLWEALSENEISVVLQSDGSMRQIASVLVDRANAAGGADNITAVAYEHQL